MFPQTTHFPIVYVMLPHIRNLKSVYKEKKLCNGGDVGERAFISLNRMWSWMIFNWWYERFCVYGTLSWSLCFFRGWENCTTRSLDLTLLLWILSLTCCRNAVIRRYQYWLEENCLPCTKSSYYFICNCMGNNV